MHQKDGSGKLDEETTRYFPSALCPPPQLLPAREETIALTK
ncbi:MAG: hypothetical protein SFW36_01740 [Leptolyngbyaceae cyanobacterium bins.59]|nr:hypothetical protein [Leptolyngbyaceae cyanobacterium bins.59]